MSEKMIPIPFGQLIKWMIREYKTRNSVFGVGSEKFYRGEAAGGEMFGPPTAP